MLTRYMCCRCRHPVETETELDYPFYCRNCDENMFTFEITLNEREKMSMKKIEKDSKVDVIEAVYYNVTSWKLDDLLRSANHDLEPERPYTREHVVDVFVKYNCITVSFTDGVDYTEEGGYDHDVDWKEPRQLRLWTDSYEEVLTAEETELHRLHEAAPVLLSALERIVGGLPREYYDRPTVEALLASARDAIARAKGEK